MRDIGEKEEGGQNRDDGDHDQQLDQGKCLVFLVKCTTTLRVYRSDNRGRAAPQRYRLC